MFMSWDTFFGLMLKALQGSLLFAAGILACCLIDHWFMRTKYR